MMRHYSLIDGAMVYDALRASPLFTDPLINWHAPLLSGDNRRIAGPILIDMDLLNNEDETTKVAVEQILNGVPGQLHVSRLQSESDLTTLAKHLQRYTCIDDGELLLGLRFADTRILTNLPDVFTTQQWGEMTAPIQEWIFLNRRGEEVALALPEDRTSIMAENKPLTLSAQQLDTLIDAAEPDMLLNQLNYTPHTMGDQMQMYWELAQQSVKLWQQSGARDRSVLRQFASKVLNSNGAILQEHDWVKVLATVKSNELLSV